jgi:aarF domain-containing kinase
MPLAVAQLQDLRERISDSLRPWSRSAQFWVRAADIYTSYKVGELARLLVACFRGARWYGPVVRCRVRRV